MIVIFCFLCFREVSSRQTKTALSWVRIIINFTYWTEIGSKNFSDKAHLTEIRQNWNLETKSQKKIYNHRTELLSELINLEDSRREISQIAAASGKGYFSQRTVWFELQRNGKFHEPLSKRDNSISRIWRRILSRPFQQSLSCEHLIRDSAITPHNRYAGWKLLRVPSCVCVPGAENCHKLLRGVSLVCRCVCGYFSNAILGPWQFSGDW